MIPQSTLKKTIKNNKMHPAKLYQFLMISIREDLGLEVTLELWESSRYNSKE
jgi:hypothetical protein